MTSRVYQGLLLTSLALVGAGCETSPPTFNEPGSSEGVELPTLTVRAEVHDRNAGLADTLGWEEGIPQARVHLLRIGTDEWITELTDETGAAVFERIETGIYRLYAERVLVDAEVDEVGRRRAFGDGRTIGVGGPEEVTLDLVADRPGGLMISEIGSGTPPPWEISGGSSTAGLFLEVYNGSERTIFLDGLMVVDGQFLGFRDDYNPCTRTQELRTDSLGLYTAEAMAFPGSGSEYPIEPGETKVIANQAADHTSNHPSMLDLRDADFEFLAGEGLADNPAVPNMVERGLRPFHDGALLATNNALFLSEPVDFESLPIRYRARRGQAYVRVPADRVIDVVATEIVWPEHDLEAPPCRPMLPDRFDRYPGGFKRIGLEVSANLNQSSSVQRRVLRDGPDGHPVLFNTTTSAVDVEHADPRTPGSIPDWLRAGGG